ncbi:MAG TPA: FtsX-like permease family protein [Vicinamibacterales bacterium]|nr:FtsX-like permease family protein [Vicinamibacterales bacterium]
MALVLKTERDPLALAGALGEVVHRIDPNIPLADVRTMEQVTATALAAPRFAAFLLGVFAVLALTLAAVGTYATISLLVAERTNEIGIRMALGAERRAIVASVLREGLIVALGGVALGIGGAIVLSRTLDTLVFGVTTRDPVTFTAVPIILMIVVGIASLMPARRAAALDPINALRQ